MTVVPLNPRREGAADARAMPASADAEMAFLGALLIQNDVYAQVAGFLEADHFSEELNRRIYAIAAGLIGQGRLVNPVTIRPFLGDHDLGDGITIQRYLARLAAEATTIINARDYALSIRDLATRRAMIAAARDLETQAFDAPVDMRPAEIASGAMDRLAGLAEDPAKSKRVAAGASAAMVVARAQEIISGAAQASGVSTGIAELDEATGGFRPAKLWLLAGRPGMGKSACGNSLALKVARNDHPVLSFSLELDEEENTARLLADLSYSARRPITFQQIARGQLDEDELWTVSDAQRRLERMPFWVDYSSKLTPADVKARIHAENKRLAAKRLPPLAVVFIDYLKQLQASDRYKGNRNNEIGEITGSLKQTTKDENVCIVLLVQLNRGLESREDKRPGLGDLRDSGELEQDADVVAFIHREHYYLEKLKGRSLADEDIRLMEETKNQADLILGKNRMGPSRTIQLFCNIGCSMISARSKYEGEAMF